MTSELSVLAWSVVLGLVHIGVAAAAVTHQRGLAWNVSARDGTAAPLAGVAARLARAQANFFETFPLFAALVLGVVVAGKADAQTLLGAQVYLWARVAYLPLYAFGIPYVRTIAFGVAVWGLPVLLRALL
jgi:uncharacterized MAPEG superfamily protein